MSFIKTHKYRILRNEIIQGINLAREENNITLRTNNYNGFQRGLNDVVAGFLTVEHAYNKELQKNSQTSKKS